ncbi:Probable phospholipid-transporting ATPase IA (ATPase class I type 8A member 1) (Chromaffin granule ATPase II) [Durusdinium trenchii]|uniref:Probable phospholipid-transporting ATPase IA (ATPase class I type 8A member 1) (Chromaffin granule ATPase II) n=1 Tax=Durusdinium trenchii TaxID=1381693 RepID=A0ABP0ILC6_9DINO
MWFNSPRLPHLIRFRHLSLFLVQDLAKTYPNNKVITSKYTVLTFVPKNVWEQFHKAANSYFLLISFIMFIGNYTPLFHGFIQFYSTFLALLIMMTASAVIAALDDLRRHDADVKTNGQIAHRVTGDGDGRCSSEDVRWADVVVGDILIIEGECEFPADLVPLASSSQAGGCYVDTANLDGESNLKLKESVKCTQQQLRYATTDQPLLDQAVANLSTLKGHVAAEAPQKSIHSFKGRIELDSGTQDADEALDAKHLLLRGTVLKNTSWVLGLVVYTGPESRMVMNSREAKAKYPNIEKVINRSMLVVVGAQCLMALISDILYLVTKQQFLSLWYLFPAGEVQSILLPEFIGYWLTFFVLYSNLMPISLYFTMEVCNAAQAYFIKNDLQMYDEAKPTMSHEGEIYGETGEESGFQGRAAMLNARLKNPSQAAAIDAVLEVLAVSHTVVSTKDRSGRMKYEAESPDEGALVEAVGRLGWVFTGRTNEGLTVEAQHHRPIQPSLEALNAFTSARKRQSVLVRRPSGEVVLLVKGADDVMQKLAADPQSFPEEHLRAFAKQGLRTLVMGRRWISEAELRQWHQEYTKAQTSMQERFGDLQSLETLGITGIEDKLQVGVEDAIVKIRQAGIKLWVLTGDKLETAKNIGFSTRVLSSSMEILTLDLTDRRAFKDRHAGRVEAGPAASNNGVTVALIVTGHALEARLMTGHGGSQGGSQAKSQPKGKYQDLFLEVAVRCSVVIACRVSPLQKAEVVTVVRTDGKGVKPTPVTLAIGDGANDVPMLQEAQVGVGISGREGRPETSKDAGDREPTSVGQAVNCADFAISQFRYLARLMLVHGRWNYRRACQSLFEDMVRASYNFVLAAPIITTGVFDQDVTEEQVMADPRLYVSGREGLDLNASKLVEMLLSAAVHSCVIGFVMLMVFYDMSILQTGDFYTFGTTVFTVLVISMNYRAAFVTRTWNWVTLAGQACSFLIYLIFLLVYCNIEWMTEHFQLDTELFLLIVFLELFHGACSLMPGVNLLAHVCCC